MKAAKQQPDARSFSCHISPHQPITSLRASAPGSAAAHSVILFGSKHTKMHTQIGPLVIAELSFIVEEPSVVRKEGTSFACQEMFPYSQSFHWHTG